MPPSTLFSTAWLNLRQSEQVEKPQHPEKNDLCIAVTTRCIFHTADGLSGGAGAHAHYLQKPETQVSRGLSPVTRTALPQEGQQGSQQGGCGNRHYWFFFLKNISNFSYNFKISFFFFETALTEKKKTKNTCQKSCNSNKKPWSNVQNKRTLGRHQKTLRRREGAGGPGGEERHAGSRCSHQHARGQRALGSQQPAGVRGQR